MRKIIKSVFPIKLKIDTPDEKVFKRLTIHEEK